MTALVPRLVFLDAATYGDISLEPFRRWDCAVYMTTSPAELPSRLSGRSVAVTNKVPLDRQILQAPEALDLRLIAVAATGTDIIDRDAARARGIGVCNVPGYATRSVAQFTIALLLELATSVSRYAAAVRAGSWQRSPVFTLLDYPSSELHGRTLGIVGYGNIGKEVAGIARALGLRVVVAGRPDSPVASDRLPLARLLQESDFVSLHCPLTPQTRHLINRATLDLMKPTAFLINTARGGLIDEPALIEALRNGRLAGAAVDVISVEPPPPGHPMTEAAKELPNLIVTPHTAWSAREARQRLLDEVRENIEAFLAGRPRNLV
ncbi:MAG TPA: D-2-hydroxyacid dehydrogenase [candidate division Zixibacteria bacterium]|nr:D-2-hydroxyacid dehydrogenase [candidate division Zixibacteria bacterium]